MNIITDGVCQLLFHFASTDLVRSAVISLPACLTHRPLTLRLAMIARGCIHQCHTISRSQAATTRHNNHLSLLALHSKRPLLTIHRRDLSSSSNLSSWSSLKLRWPWHRLNLFSRTLVTSYCHVSLPGAAAAPADSLPSSWLVSVTVLFINSTTVTNTRTAEKKKSRTAEEGKFTLYLYIRFYTR